MVSDSGGMLEVGDAAPDFSLASNAGGELRLADARQDASVALFFVRETT